MMSSNQGQKSIWLKVFRKANLLKKSKPMTYHKKEKTLKTRKDSSPRLPSSEQSNLCHLHLRQLVLPHRLLHFHIHHIHLSIHGMTLAITKIPMTIGSRSTLVSNPHPQTKTKIKIIIPMHKIIKSIRRDNEKWMYTYETSQSITIKMISCWHSSRMRGPFDKFDAPSKLIAQLWGFWRRSMPLSLQEAGNPFLIAAISHTPSTKKKKSPKNSSVKDKMMKMATLRNP